MIPTQLTMVYLLAGDFCKITVSINVNNKTCQLALSWPGAEKRRKVCFVQSLSCGQLWHNKPGAFWFLYQHFGKCGKILNKESTGLKKAATRRFSVMAFLHQLNCNMGIYFSCTVTACICKALFLPQVWFVEALFDYWVSDFVKVNLVLPFEAYLPPPGVSINQILDAHIPDILTKTVNCSNCIDAQGKMAKLFVPFLVPLGYFTDAACSAAHVRCTLYPLLILIPNLWKET